MSLSKHVEYYQSIMLIKKNYIKQMNQICGRKREIYKIWAHWLIRQLFNNYDNFHVLSHIQLDTIDNEIIKHMTNNKIDTNIGMNIHNNLLVSYNRLYINHSVNHIQLFNNKCEMLELTKMLMYNENVIDDTISISFDQVPITIRLLNRVYNKMKKLYKGDPDLFLFSLFECCFNYYILDGKSLQWSLPNNVFSYMTDIGLSGELFASPMNSYSNVYYSIFHVDRFFGSGGSFINLINNQLMIESGGLFEVNPPFIEDIFNHSLVVIFDILDKSKSSLGFIYIMPVWDNFEAYDNITSSKYYINHVTIDKYKHNYYQCCNNKNIMATFDTNIVVIGNSKFNELFDVNKILNSIKSIYAKY